METSNIKKLWIDTHSTFQKDNYENVNVSEIIKMNHSKTIAKVLSDLKFKIYGYLLMLSLLICLILYALVYLRLNLSVPTLTTFSFIGLFFILNIISVIHRLLIITKTANTLSLKESVNFFRKKLNRMKATEFISSLIYFYTLISFLIYNYISAIGGLRYLSWNNRILPLALIAICMLLSIPWLIKYQNQQRYKKISANLNASANYLNDEA